ncbi:MAG: hypothetical protein K6B65_06865 [Bacilli bacterium]|nr:hypothetical protein [Bacilli bacterium]
MITIQVLGLDQFVVGHYSREHTSNIANLFEVPDEEVNFYAPNSMVFHKGVEQTSWNTVVNVLCPHRFESFEKVVADYILKTLCEFSINIQVVFSYYHDKSEYTYSNPEYPRYLKDENIKEADISIDYDMPKAEGEEEPSEGDGEAPSEEETDIFLGNAFEGFEEAFEKKRKGN